MGRSQRHQLENYNTTSAGYIYAQGVVAPTILAQDAGTQAFAGAKDVDASGWAVPIGGAGGPLAGSALSGAIPESVAPPVNPDNPAPGEEPMLNSINPSSADIGDPDLEMHVIGNKFTETSVIVFNGGDEPTTFVSDNELTTIIKPSTASTPGSYPVAVRQGEFFTEEKMFTFEEAGEELEGRIFPIGPSNIEMITDHEDGLEVELADTLAVEIGDMVRIEATGNTSINGDYEVLSINPIVINSSVVLETPIENKGRLTVTGD